MLNVSDSTQLHNTKCPAWWHSKATCRTDCLLNQQRAKEQSRRQREIESNREVLSHLLDIIRLLAKQNLALRGHDESAISQNRGKFLELVYHQAKYDLILQQPLQKAGKNATCHQIFRISLFVQWPTRFWKIYWWR